MPLPWWKAGHSFGAFGGGPFLVSGSLSGDPWPLSGGEGGGGSGPFGNFSVLPLSCEEGVRLLSGDDNCGWPLSVGGPLSFGPCRYRTVPSADT